MDSKHFNAYTIFALVFAFKLLFIFQGINLSDEGFHLTQQAAAYTNHVDHRDITAAYFLTQYIGGAWLKIWGAPSLLWARLGGVLIYALNAAIIFQLLSGYFDKKKTFIAVTVSTLFIAMHEYSTIIHYYTFPALLVNIWLLALSKLLKAEDRKSKAYGFLLGFLMIPISLSRLPLILMVLLPAILIAYQKTTKTKDQRLQKAMPHMVLGFIAATAAFTLLYAQLGILEYYATNVYGSITAAVTGTTEVEDLGEGHKISDLLVDYVFGFGSGILTTITMLAVLIMFFDVAKLTGQSVERYYIALIALAVAAFILVNAQDQYFRGYYVFAEYIQAVVAVILLLISALILYAHRKKTSDADLLTLVGAYALFITPLGAYTGLGRSSYGMWLILPLIILLAYEAKEKNTEKNREAAFSLLDSTIAFIAVMAIAFQMINIYTDDPNRSNLNTEFQYPPLKGIYSTPERVKAVDEALYRIDELTQKDDRTLMVNSIPLFYYLTETKPAIGDSWPVFRPIEKIQEDNEKMIAEGNYPKLFIYSKTDPGEPSWPKTNTTSLYPQSFEYYKREYTENLNYTLLWENQEFRIYKPK